MSHRERLLAAARRCLVTKGYARTTARDLVAESDTNLASIGYHFGSKDDLLNLALVQAQADYVERVLATATTTGGRGDRRSRRRESWTDMVGAFDAERPLAVAFFEALVEAERSPSLKAQQAAAYREMRRRVAESLGAGFDSDEQRDAAATYLLAVCDGLMVQWLLDPDAVPTGDAVFDAAQRFHGAGRAASARAIRT